MRSEAEIREKLAQVEKEIFVLNVQFTFPEVRMIKQICFRWVLGEEPKSMVYCWEHYRVEYEGGHEPLCPTTLKVESGAGGGG